MTSVEASCYFVYLRKLPAMKLGKWKCIQAEGYLADLPVKYSTNHVEPVICVSIIMYTDKRRYFETAGVMFSLLRLLSDMTIAIIVFIVLTWRTLHSIFVLLFIRHFLCKQPTNLFFGYPHRRRHLSPGTGLERIWDVYSTVYDYVSLTYMLL